jgi:hypothetical protein
MLYTCATLFAQSCFRRRFVVTLNHWALLMGSLGLVSIVTIYYVWLRKPAVPTQQQEQPQQQ